MGPDFLKNMCQTQTSRLFIKGFQTRDIVKRLSKIAGYIYTGTFYRNFIGLDLNLVLKEVFF